MVDHAFEFHSCLLRSGFSEHPAGCQHPRVQRRADDRIPLDQGFNLFITELPDMRHQRSAILMTCPDRPGENIQRLPETIIAKVRGIENETDPLHLFEELAACGIESSGGV